jgi:hypothetical protein
MCVIRIEFIQDDLKDILDNGSGIARSALYCAYIEVLKTLVENGADVNIPYNIYSKEDMIELLKDYDKMTAFCIRDLVAEYENNETFSEWFVMNGGTYEFYTIEEFGKEVNKYIPSIANEILIRPFEGAFKQLYNMIVVPMVLNQKS